MAFEELSLRIPRSDLAGGTRETSNPTIPACWPATPKRSADDREANEMFGDDDRDRVATLAEMERLSRLRTNFDQVAARQVFRSYLDGDRRFDEFDKDKLVARVQEAKACGAVLDLTDPVLRGQAPRPLDRRW
jgi:hypothetical protein